MGAHPLCGQRPRTCGRVEWAAGVGGRLAGETGAATGTVWHGVRRHKQVAPIPHLATFGCFSWQRASTSCWMLASLRSLHREGSSLSTVNTLDCGGRDDEQPRWHKCITQALTCAWGMARWYISATHWTQAPNHKPPNAAHPHLTSLAAQRRPR